MIHKVFRSSAQLACGLGFGITLFWGTAGTAVAQAPTPTPSAPGSSSQLSLAAVTALYNKENAAIASSNYAQFIESGTPAFKKALTKETFTKSCAKVSSNVKTGYTSEYTGQKSIPGGTIYAWNLTCKNGVKYLAVLGISGRRVAAYFYQPPMPTHQ